MKKILIVDDDPFVRDMFEKALKPEGFDIITAENGEDGLILFASHSPQIIILDLNMPKLDGFEFLEALKPQIPSPYSIIVTTGYASDEHIRRCYQLGIHTFLRKPVNVYELKGTVERTFQLMGFSEKLKIENDEKQRANDLLKATFDSIMEGSMIMNLHFEVRMISAKACQILGVEEKEVLGKPAARILGTSFGGPSGMLSRMTKERRKVMDLHTSVLSQTQGMIPVRMSIIPLESENIQNKWLLIFQDLQEEEKKLLQKAGGSTFGKMVSGDPGMWKIFKLLDKVSSSNANILIEGQSGTGKELVAREIYLRSKRSRQPYHIINCAAISPGLLESEFFGHEKGAFTGADKQKIGWLEKADGGTLFLDEIGEMPLELQGKLLRVLQEQTFSRVGSTKNIQVDIRFVAATNRDLKKMVAEKQFREDLYFRLNVVKINLPSLKERSHDIPLLVSRFIEEFNQRESRDITNATMDAMHALKGYSWPGNIRELRHAIERAFAISSGKTIQLSHLPEEMIQYQNVADTHNDSVNQDQSSTALDEKSRILQALKETNFHKKKAAVLLGIGRATLYRKLDKYGLKSQN